MIKHLKDFFAAVWNTRKGILVPEELYRSILTSLSSGSFVSLTLTILQSMLSHVAVIFPNPLIGGMMTMVLTLLIDLVRRLNQGPTPPIPAPIVVPVPVPTPVPTPVPVADEPTL